VQARPTAWWWPARRTEPAIDPGLQAERTAMAWQRTALGVGAVGALLIHHAGGVTWGAIPGALGLLVGLVLILASEGRYERTVHRVRSGQQATSRGLVRTLAGITVLLAASALVLVVAGGG
jgi:uncharacterized membrane protein YidH (DUF202 family)